jgi:hypothetical protein
MLICAFYADQANYKNSAFNAYHQVNAVSCLSARLMLSSRTIRHVSCLSLWSKLEIALSRNDHFFGNGLSSSSFLFPPNQKVYVLDLSVLCTYDIFSTYICRGVLAFIIYHMYRTVAPPFSSMYWFILQQRICTPCTIIAPT